jgi:phthalate 4,5-cis-dihydrodiol dehydrogenase
MSLTLADCDTMIAATEQAGTRLVIGHSQAYSPPVLTIRDVVRSGELGRLGMINTWNYKDLVYTPRRPEELDPANGGGAIYNQAPHQVDTVRWIGGGLVRSVRAMTGIWDPARPIEGAYNAFLEFEDGASATVAFNGYGRFDTDEFHFWIGEGGQPKPPERYGNARRELEGLKRDEEAAVKAALAYGGTRQRAIEFGGAASEGYHPHFGVLLVSCERGDLRPSPRGVFVYDDRGRREIPVPVSAAGKFEVVDELYQAVAHDRAVRHDGRWGKATLEVCLAILESGRERCEVRLAHQVPTPD